METQNKELTITRTFNAPIDLVWAAWTDVEHIKNWWGPKGFTNPVCQWNSEAGSKLYIEMKAPDGVIYPMDGEFYEIKLHEKIVFSAGAVDKSGKRLFDIQNTIHFIEEGDKTKITLHFEMSNVTSEGAPYLKGQEMGWNMSLDKLATLLDNLK
jgi:uncharacterized protein YndB with AHSA1/START domain